MHIIVFGNGNAGANLVLSVCRNEKDEITYIYEYGYPIKESNVNNIVFLAFKGDELSIVRKLKCDFIMVAGWHRKFSTELVCQYECFNIHPSLLPKYRGVYPMEFQLYNKEKQGGVTIHKMDEGFDTGPIYMQQSFSLERIRSMEEFVLLVSRTTRRMVQYFVERYPEIIGYEQDEAQASYYCINDKTVLEENELS